METVNHECYVSLEVAKLLKEAGFDWEIDTLYFPYHKNKNEVNQESVPRNWNSKNADPDGYMTISAPTLEIAQRWLRKVKNLILLIDITPSYCNGKPMGYKFVIHVSCGNYIWGEWKDTYEEALEAGIKKALELILEKGE